MTEYELPGVKWANIDIVGEFAHKDDLRKIIGGRRHSGDPVTKDIRVDLVPEPDNPYSKSGKAISVRVAGAVIGHLSEADAKKWAPELHRISASGATATTLGSVYAYSKYNGEMEFNVRVGLPDPGFLAPLNAGQVSGVSVLPWGNALQVTKEEDHLDHLFEYVPAGGTGLVILTMHSIENTLKNGTVRELVEVRLDGERVGQMTVSSSAHFLPSIRHAKDMGVELGAWAKLKGSGLAVELVVQGARATDLSDSWLREMPTMHQLVPVSESYDVPNAYVPDKKSLTTPKKNARSVTNRALSRHDRFEIRLASVDAQSDASAVDSEHRSNNAEARVVTSAESQNELTRFGSALFLAGSILLYALCALFAISGLGAVSDEEIRGMGISFLAVSVFCWIGGRKLGKRAK